MQDLYVPDCIYQTDNDLEIPTLRMDMQAQATEIPFVCYGEQRRTFQMHGHGTLHFYTDDYRFTAVYEHPEQILKHDPVNIVEPNFSLFEEMPVAFGLQAVYKKRMIARSMQDKGIRVFVDLNVATKWYKLNMIGVPMGWSSFCTRGYSDRTSTLEFEYEMARYFANGNNLLFVVYGGGETIKAWCREHNAVYVAPLITLKNKYKAMKKIQESIAFGKEDFSLSLTVNTDAQAFFAENQISDFTNQLTE